MMFDELLQNGPEPGAHAGWSSLAPADGDGGAHADPGPAPAPSPGPANLGALMMDVFGHYADGAGVAAVGGPTPIEPGIAHGGAEYDGDGPPAARQEMTHGRIIERQVDGATANIIIGLNKGVTVAAGAPGHVVGPGGRPMAPFQVSAGGKGECRASGLHATLDQLKQYSSVEVQATASAPEPATS
jgi:hypothetical protein